MCKLNPCKDCGAILKGRADKKFCNDYCRSHFHAIRNRDLNKDIRIINAILRKNRQILLQFLEQGKTYVSQWELHQQGYRQQYYTHTIDKGDLQGKFCYDIGLEAIQTAQFKIYRSSAYDNYLQTG